MNSELQNCQQTEPCTVEEIRNSLEQSEKGKVYNTAANYKRVLQYDPLLKGAIRKNLLTERIDIVKPLGCVPFPVSWTVKMKKKQKETQDILSYHTQAAGCSDKARAKASGGRQPIEECGRTGL